MQWTLEGEQWAKRRTRKGLGWGGGERGHLKSFEQEDMELSGHYTHCIGSWSDEENAKITSEGTLGHEMRIGLLKERVASRDMRLERLEGEEEGVQRPLFDHVTTKYSPGVACFHAYWDPQPPRARFGAPICIQMDYCCGC